MGLELQWTPFAPLEPVKWKKRKLVDDTHIIRYAKSSSGRSYHDRTDQIGASFCRDSQMLALAPGVGGLTVYLVFIFFFMTVLFIIILFIL